jgi:hypothetical protein
VQRVNFSPRANNSPEPVDVAWSDPRDPVQRRASLMWRAGCPISSVMRDEWAEMRGQIEQSVARLRVLIAEAHALTEQVTATRSTGAPMGRICSAHDDQRGQFEGGHKPCF